MPRQNSKRTGALAEWRTRRRGQGKDTSEISFRPLSHLSCANQLENTELCNNTGSDGPSMPPGDNVSRVLMIFANGDAALRLRLSNYRLTTSAATVSPSSSTSQSKHQGDV